MNFRFHYNVWHGYGNSQWSMARSIDTGDMPLEWTIRTEKASEPHRPFDAMQCLRV
ncbi:MAG: hypothetical protein JRE81_16665 [Deltaproteobacteria bacterium]|nr:hypothetical protein [Deltaproteobacteria bacterium]